MIEMGKLSAFEKWFDVAYATYAQKCFDEGKDLPTFEQDLTLIIAFWPGPLTGVVKKGSGDTFEIKVRTPDGDTVREVATMTFNPEYVVFWYPADVPPVTKEQNKKSNIILQ